MSLYPKKQNLHVDTKREVNTSIKGKERQGGGGSQKEDKSYKREKGKDTMLLGRSPRT